MPLKGKLNERNALKRALSKTTFSNGEYSLEVELQAIEMPQRKLLAKLMCQNNFCVIINIFTFFRNLEQD